MTYVSLISDHDISVIENLNRKYNNGNRIPFFVSLYVVVATVFKENFQLEK